MCPLPAVVFGAMGPKATYRTRTYVRNGRIARTRTVPGTHLERSLLAQGAELVGGVDEVGVGAWAGPLAVGAVVLRPDRRLYKIRDSKLLDPERREFLAARVRQNCLAWSIGLAWPDEIDALGLSEAQRRAAERARAGLGVAPDVFLVDGKWDFMGTGGVSRMVVRGDCESVSIAAASIVAKVARDRLMCELAGLYPPYELRSNKGYPSPRHRWALAAFGPSPIHRRLFTPVQKLLDEGVPGRLLPSFAAGVQGGSSPPERSEGDQAANPLVERLGPKGASRSMDKTSPARTEYDSRADKEDNRRER